MASFQELINGAEPVLVDFHAEWCEPCKMMAPELEKAAAQLGERAKIVKVDIDKNQSAAAQLGIQSVPTLMVFQQGEIKYQQAGFHSAQQIVQALDSI